MKITKKILLIIASAILLVYLVLLIPDSPVGRISPAGEKPFAWNKDDLWKELENTFLRELTADPLLREAYQVKLKDSAEAMLADLDSRPVSPGDPLFTGLLNNFFRMATVIAAGKKPDSWFTGYYNRVRNSIKLQSGSWDMGPAEARNTIYKVLYGFRAAVEEVLLQSPGMKFDPVMFVRDEPSVTPSASIFGIRVHSGDLLVSRGGAVVSALISRGNDYPGNFSHVAIIYVDEKTAVPYLVEAHIERGVAVSSVSQYIADKKLRFMVMRPRIDLPQLRRDPMIPHKAAKYVYDQALARHIPYDFKMDFHDSSAMFCSEVGSSAYLRYGINLWRSPSTISSPGVVTLLNTFGVENFTTMMPSDLEYDPQLAVVAEWRDPQTLFRDHMFNAVMDVMLEYSDTADETRNNPLMLPLARFTKGYSLVLNLFHKEGPVPEGMSATQGLKHNAFTGLHSRILRRTEEKAAAFIERFGYSPPYWQMITMAKESWPE